MTTMALMDATLAKFGRKAPRDCYKAECAEHKIHYQRDIYHRLPEVPSAWHRIRTLELDGSLLGPKGALPLLKIILVSTTLRKISLVNCGLTDEFVKELCEILINHPAVRVVDVSLNELISVFSISSIISLMKSNTNMIAFHTAGTHVGENVTDIINKLGARNKEAVSLYYTDNYFRLKNIFGYLDENGEGWVSLKSLIMNCPYPVLQEQFVERIAKVKPRQRSDNTINVNTFMSLVYMNYKTEREILDYGNQEMEEPYIFMVSNWKQILSAMDRYNEEAEGNASNVGVLKPAELPEDLHRIRIKDFLLTNEDANSVVLVAVQLQEEENQKQMKETDDVVRISALHLLQAVREALRHPKCGRPEPIHYQFYEERDPAFVPEVMRNGSRLADVSTVAGMSPQEEGEEDSTAVVGDPPHTWQLPPSLVSMIAEYFHRVYERLPKRRQTATPASPTAQRDRAMTQMAIPIESLLDVTFENDFEVLKPALLANFFSMNAMPIEDSTITLAEIVNVLDELYLQLSVEKPLTKQQIMEMQNPFGVPEYAEFLAQYLFGDTEA